MIHAMVSQESRLSRSTYFENSGVQRIEFGLERLGALRQRWRVEYGSDDCAQRQAAPHARVVAVLAVVPKDEDQSRRNGPRPVRRSVDASGVIEDEPIHAMERLLPDLLGAPRTPTRRCGSTGSACY